MSHLISIPLETCFQILARCDASDDIKRVIRDAIAEKMTELEKRFTPLPPPPGWEPVTAADVTQALQQGAPTDLRPRAEVVIVSVPAANGITTVYGIKDALSCTYATARAIFEKVRGKWDFQTQSYVGGASYRYFFHSLDVAKLANSKLIALDCITTIRSYE